MGSYQKRTPEEKAKWLENHRRLQQIIERRLAEEEAARVGEHDQREERTRQS